MSWKPKEKELTAQEAIILAKSELSPFWFGSSPQIAGIRSGNQCSVVPLNPDFLKKTWLLLFLDLMCFAGEQALIYAREWNKRYSSYQIGLLGVLMPTYDFLKIPHHAQKVIEDHQISFPIMVDLEEAVASSFQVLNASRVILLHRGQRYFDYSGYEGFNSAELDIQEFLRSMDPGLPLLPIFQNSRVLLNDVRRVEFGASAKPDYQAGQMHGMRPKKLKKDQIVIMGNWVQDAEKITTSDQHAVINIYCSSIFFSIIANSEIKSGEVPKISIEIDGQPPFEAIAGTNLIVDESGLSLIKPLQPKLYHVLEKLLVKEHEITLRFPTANSAAVSLYGLRFGD